MWASTYSDIIMHTGDIDRYQKAIHHQAEQSKRVQKRLYGIIAGLVLVLAVSMVGTFTSSLVAVESAKDTVISADGAFVDKNTGVPVSTENPHFTTMAAVQVQGLLSGEVNVALRGQKSALLRQFGARCATAGPIKVAQAAALTLDASRQRCLESAASYELER